MINLAASDTIAGGASVASKVTCTIFGMELNGTTEVYKVLDQRQLAAAPATIYTAPASNTAFIKTITVVNTDTVRQSFQLFRGGTAAANAITPSILLPPGGMAVYADNAGWSVYDANGSLLTRQGTAPSESNFRVGSMKAETIPRHLLMEVNTSALASGRLQLQAIWLVAGTVINNIHFWSATTAAGTPTNQIFGLYDSSLNLLANTNNDTTTAWAANTQKTLALTSQYTVPTTGLYYLGIMVTATTVPTLKGHTAPAATTGPRGATPKINGTSTTGLTTSLPNPAAAITDSTTPIWGGVS